MKLTKFLAISIFVFLAACGSPKTEQSNEANDPAKAPSAAESAETAKSKEALSTVDGMLITREKRESTLLFGQFIETDRNALFTSLQLITPAIMRQINNAGAVVTGAVTFVYDGVPGNTEQIRVFLGVPIKSSFRNEGETEFITVPESEYFKMVCNSDIGQTASFHQKMQRWLRDQGLQAQSPVFEVASESRNNEMAVETRMSLFYKAP